MSVHEAMQLRLKELLSRQLDLAASINDTLKLAFPVGAMIEFETAFGPREMVRAGVIGYKVQGGVGVTSLVVNCKGRRFTKTVSPHNVGSIRIISTP